MLQNLLAERFHLTLHHETREFQVYSLLVAKGGPKMKPSSPDADAPPASPDQHRLDSKGFPVLPQGRAAVYMNRSGMVVSTHRQTVLSCRMVGAHGNMSNGDGIVRAARQRPM